MKLTFTRSQAQQLLAYVKQAEADGWYYGSRDQFMKRHEQIKVALFIGLKEERHDDIESD